MGNICNEVYLVKRHTRMIWAYTSPCFKFKVIIVLRPYENLIKFGLYIVLATMTFIATK